MFRITFDGSHAPRDIEADAYTIDEGWIWFTKGGVNATSVKEFNVLTIDSIDSIDKGGNA
jgi:hypothetical protein